MKTKPRTVEQLIKLADLDDPEKLLKRAVCPYCGMLRITEKTCQKCKAGMARTREQRKEYERLRPKKMYAAELLGAYEHVFVGAKSADQAKVRSDVAAKMILLEIRSCFKNNHDGTYALPQENVQRVSRLLGGLDLMIKYRHIPKLTALKARIKYPPVMERILRFVVGEFGFGTIDL